MHKLILGLGGSSGAIYAKLLLERLSTVREQVEEVGIVMSKNARINWDLEISDRSIESYGFKIYDKDDFNAPFASGSARFNTMIICPCSMGTLARIANGYAEDLMTRAADVILKERRKLVVVPRETPFSIIHLDNMRKLTEAGAIICPAIPSFYSKPDTIEKLCLTVVDRVLDLAGFKLDTFRWGEKA
ncbi:MAG TPA: UbiX family flavin prenyltransferase [Saprospiraceae bacterium]|nr:UbiX family flavin prenyltransferase [Saprospiraceae bacterium]